MASKKPFGGKQAPPFKKKSAKKGGMKKGKKVSPKSSKLSGRRGY